MFDSVARKIMAVMAGGLIGMNIPQDAITQFASSGTEILAGILLYAVSQGWSIAKKRAEKKLLEKLTVGQ